MVHEHHVRADQTDEVVPRLAHVTAELTHIRTRQVTDHTDVVVVVLTQATTELTHAQIHTHTHGDVSDADHIDVTDEALIHVTAEPTSNMDDATGCRTRVPTTELVQNEVFTTLEVDGTLSNACKDVNVVVNTNLRTFAKTDRLTYSKLFRKYTV